MEITAVGEHNIILIVLLGAKKTMLSKRLSVKQQLTFKITKFNLSYFFIDEMISEIFKSIHHEHVFEEKENQTLMIDKFFFESPFAIIEKLVNRIFFKYYMAKLLITINQFLKTEAEKIEFTPHQAFSRS